LLTALVRPCITQSRRSYDGQELMTFYGYKFEALCTGSDSVDATSEYSAVLQTRIGKTNVLMAAEIDCCMAGCSDPVSSHVELKTYV
jgi:hypothetical protein